MIPKFNRTYLKKQYYNDLIICQDELVFIEECSNYYIFSLDNSNNKNVFIDKSNYPVCYSRDTSNDYLMTVIVEKI